ncbi:hypothetical protein [Paenibacillus montanisoli]|uniref:hypothetical protein n=1 Tax=Paenibacillus montanisoli TaxID=2081970 RepID=UPI00105821F3|nr:hypothetical protein [Paenibacillus montanisoli]
MSGQLTRVPPFRVLGGRLKVFAGIRHVERAPQRSFYGNGSVERRLMEPTRIALPIRYPVLLYLYVTRLLVRLSLKAHVLRKG